MKCLFGEIPFSVRVPIWWYWLVPNQRHLATEIHQCLKLVSGGLNLSLDNVKIGRSIVFSAQTLTGFQRKCETNQRWFVCVSKLDLIYKKLTLMHHFPPRLLVELIKKHQRSSNFLRGTKTSGSTNDFQRLPEFRGSTMLEGSQFRFMFSHLKCNWQACGMKNAGTIKTRPNWWMLAINDEWMMVDDDGWCMMVVHNGWWLMIMDDGGS